MSFSSEVKDEILSKPIKDDCCKKAFIAGVIRGNGNLYALEDGFCLDFKVNSERAFLQVSEYVEYIYNYRIRDVEVFEDRLNKNDSFVASIRGDGAEKILLDLGVLIRNGDEYGVDLRFYGGAVESCCVKSFFKGLFISCGYCTVPQKAGSKKTRYHLEMSFNHPSAAYAAAGKLHENGVAAAIVRRKGGYVVYVNSGEEMKNFLAFIGAPVSALKLTELMVSGEMTNMINRRKNCDVANVVRQMDAAEKQIAAVLRIKENSGIESLNSIDLIETAVARLENPEDSVAELATKLGVSKSCVNHRLRKITAIANAIV